MAALTGVATDTGYYYETTQDLSAAALDADITISQEWRIGHIMLVADQAITETVSVKLFARAVTANVVTLDSTALAAATSYVYEPSGPSGFNDGDQLTVACTDGNSVGTVYLRVNIITAPGS